MSTILFMWALVGYAGTQFSVHPKYEWRPMGEFATVADCQRAAHELVIDTSKFRCVSTGKKGN